MGLRFRKSFKIAPGIRLNVGKKSAGLSFGGRGLRYSINSNGLRTSSIGIPGSGLYYTTTTSGKPNKTPAYQRRNELVQMEKENRKLAELDYAKLQVEFYENRLDQIRAIHHECDDNIDWREVAKRIPPFEDGKVGPSENSANQKLLSYKPSFFDRLLLRVQTKKSLLEKELVNAKKEDKKLRAEWNEMTKIAKRMVHHDIDAYFEVIDEYRPLDDLVEFGSKFEFGTDNERVIHVSFDVDAKKVIPEETLSLTKTGKLSTKMLTKTAYFDLFQDYVCSCALRIARDMFALLPVEFVFVHTFEEKLNTATGYIERQAILSVKYDLNIFEQLNFANLDPSDALTNFEHKMDFKKTKGFQQIDIVEK